MKKSKNKNRNNHVKTKNRMNSKNIKVIYDYNDFCVRKTIGTKGASVLVNIPIRYSRILKIFGGQTLKIRVIGQKLVMSKIDAR